MIYSMNFYPSIFIRSVKIALLFHNNSELVLHLTAALMYKVYNLLISFKGKKYITIILSIVLCWGDPHPFDITEKCVLALSEKDLLRKMSRDKDKITDDTRITFRTKNLR
jgi:hypothetical protein